MNLIEISSLPDILFSHIYKADAYRTHFAVRENFFEITYIAEGSLELTVGKNSFHAQKGDIVCFLHNAETAVAAEAFHCHHTVGARVIWHFADGQPGGLLLPAVISSENGTSGICRIIDDLIYNQILYRTSKTNGAARFLELLCAIDKCSRRARSPNPPGELLYVQRAKDYIQQNIHEAITQRSIAEYLDISPEYLCTVFKKAEGTTVMRYINKLKLENIKAFIDHTNVHLYEAAAIYGYSDPNYVSRLYKQLFGYNITDKPHIYPEIK